MATLEPPIAAENTAVAHFSVTAEAPVVGAQSPFDTAKIPMLLQVLGLSWLIGSAIGVAFVSSLLLFNVAGLKDLIVRSDVYFLAMFLLYFFNMLTFSSVTMGITIMRLPWDDDKR
jgi:hypothetical protein